MRRDRARRRPFRVEGELLKVGDVPQGAELPGYDMELRERLEGAVDDGVASVHRRDLVAVAGVRVGGEFGAEEGACLVRSEGVFDELPRADAE